MNAYVRIWQFVRNAFTNTANSAAQLGVFERYAAPHTFNPRLTVREAFIASVAAVIRAVIGSVTFAVWGVTIWVTWVKTPYLVLRIILVLPEALLFLCTMILLQAGISAMVKHLWPQIR